MGLTVSQIQIQYSEELSLRLVAGRNGIGREVKKMAVMETRDFVYGADPDGMFVITTLSFVDKESRGIDEVIKLLSAQPSAMAVKINRYVKSIPLEIQDAAEKENVPLFEMDSDVQFSYFISVLSEALVLNSGLKVETGNCLLDDVLFQDTKDGVLIRNRLSYGGFELSDLYVFILVSVEKGKAESSDSSVMECCRKQILDCFPECLIKVDSHMLKCLVTFSKKDFFSKNGRLYDRMIAFRNSIFSKNGGIFDIGISLIQDNPADLTQSYLQAHAAVNMGKIYRPDKHVYDYRSFLVQGMLVLTGNDAPFSIVLGAIAAATAPAPTTAERLRNSRRETFCSSCFMSIPFFVMEPIVSVEPLDSAPPLFTIPSPRVSGRRREHLIGQNIGHFTRGHQRSGISLERPSIGRQQEPFPTAARSILPRLFFGTSRHRAFRCLDLLCFPFRHEDQVVVHFAEGPFDPAGLGGVAEHDELCLLALHVIAQNLSASQVRRHIAVQRTRLYVDNVYHS